MSVTLTGSEGIFQRFSRCYKEIQRVVAAYGSALNSGVDDIYEEYASGAQDVAINGLPALRESYRGVHSSYISGLIGIINTTFVEQVNADTPLTQKNLTNALNELIRQMIASSDSFNRPTISASLSQASTNYGDGVFVASMVGQYGQPLDMVMAEDVRFTCTTDANTGGATAYREVYTYAGEPALPTTDYLWPGGSAASGSMSLFDASTQTDLITNGGFDTWTTAGAAPDSSWTSVVGTFGSTLTRSTDVKRGSYSLAMTSDGSALLSVKQQLSTSIVKPNQVINFNVWVKKSTNDNTGVYRVRLIDGNGSAISNDASTANSATFTMGSGGDIGSSFTRLSGSFQTPRVLPSSGVFVQFGISTAPANGVVLTTDLFGLKVGTQIYAGGPFVSGFSSGTANALNDLSTLTIANDATTNFFVKALDRIFSLRQLGIYFPSASSETIADSVLTA